MKNTKRKNAVNRAFKSRKKKTLANIERASATTTSWIGSPASVILHTIIFAGAFAFSFFGYPLEQVLLVLTTIVSLEAIYISIFIQMTVNRNTSQLDEVVEDIEEIQEDVEGIEKDVDEIQKDVDGLEEEFEEISEEIEKDDEEEKKRDQILLDKIEGSLKHLMEEISELKKRK